jgi:hypothetical protein
MAQSDGNSIAGRTDFVRPYGTKKMLQTNTETQKNLGG